MAPVTLRHALLYLLSLGAPKAVNGPKYVLRAAGSQEIKDGVSTLEAQTLIEHLESDVNLWLAGKMGSLYSLDLPCWDGKMRLAASIQWSTDKGLAVVNYSDNSDLKRQRKAYLKKMAGKKAPKPPRYLPADTVIKRVVETAPLAMRWVRIDAEVISGVADLFAEDRT